MMSNTVERLHLAAPAVAGDRLPLWFSLSQGPGRQKTKIMKGLRS